MKGTFYFFFTLMYFFGKYMQFLDYLHYKSLYLLLYFICNLYFIYSIFFTLLLLN